MTANETRSNGTHPLRQLLQERRVLAGAGSLFFAGLLTSLFGFAFWAVASRGAIPTVVGNASAVISAMTLLSSFATLGLGTLLIGDLANARRDEVSVFRASLLTVAGLSALLGLIWAVIEHEAEAVGSSIYASLWGCAIFTFVTAVNGVSLVLDQALIGMNLSATQLFRNIAFSLGKLFLLLPFALLGHPTVTQLVTVWGMANAITVLSVLLRLRGVGASATLRREMARLRSMVTSAMAHHTMNVAAHLPMLVPPIVVASRLGGALTAPFYMALLIGGVAWSVSSNISTALFTLAPGDKTGLRRELRSAAILVCGITAVALLATLLIGRLLLQALGPSYSVGFIPLILLLCATIPNAVKSLYVAVCRIQGRLWEAACVTLIGAALEIAGCAVGCIHGISGAAAGLLIVMSAEGILLGPRVLGAAI